MKGKFNAFKESMIVLFKHLLKDSAESIFKMDKDDLATASEFIDVYNKSMDYVEELSKRIDDINAKLMKLEWHLNEIENLLEQQNENEDEDKE